MATLVVTLSRAHKIAERLKGRMNELYAEAEAVARPQTVRGVAGVSQEVTFATQGRMALELAKRADCYSRALCAVRGAIGTQNVVSGISDRLATLESLNRMLARRRKLLELSRADGVRAQELREYRPFTQSENSFGGHSIEVQMFSLEESTQLEKDVARLQQEAYALSDDIASANASNVSLTLDDDIAMEVTGSAHTGGK